MLLNWNACGIDDHEKSRYLDQCIVFNLALLCNANKFSIFKLRMMARLSLLREYHIEMMLTHIC